ncbi:hypothetical protein SUVZ_12G1820 [Saccharomyces uvarum]|uniref:U6 snRNA phosphodiesterase 1 n=1 Tax=Saccharomyces uvarum TaxID=230603 RepID=A0ABN8WNJ9_SACUV|nr:hypothetical protein SUVZ_12G1820 [Saccharomyces uvarum]
MEFITADYSSSSNSSDTDSESGNEAEIQTEPTKKARRQGDCIDLPAIPDSVLSKYHITPNLKKYEQQDMNMTPLWRSFVYCEWRPTPQVRRELQQIIFKYNKIFMKHNSTDPYQLAELSPLFLSNLGAPKPLHISLTRTLRFESEEQRHTFVQEIRHGLKHNKFAPFTLEVSPHPKLYISERANALYLGLPISECSSSTHLSSFKPIIENALQKSGILNYQKLIVTPCSFHISIAMTSNPSRATLQRYEQLNEVTEAIMLINNELTYQPAVLVNSIYCDENRHSTRIPFQ